MNDPNRSAEHLGLLSIFRYVVGGMTALCSCFPIIHLVVGVLMFSGELPMEPGGTRFTPSC